MEPEEMQEFAQKMREEGESLAEAGSSELKHAQHEIKKAGESSLTRISLAISILAVLVAMVTVLGHRSHTEAILMQSRANDVWSQYAAKKIRFDNLTVTVDILPLQPTTNAAAVATNLTKYRAQLGKWTSDLAELQKSAKEFEAEVFKAEAHASRYDLGEALLQIAVVLSSITLFTRRNTYFYFGLVLGLSGLLIAASAFLVR